MLLIGRKSDQSIFVREENDIKELEEKIVIKKNIHRCTKKEDCNNTMCINDICVTKQSPVCGNSMCKKYFDVSEVAECPIACSEEECTLIYPEAFCPEDCGFFCGDGRCDQWEMHKPAFNDGKSYYCLEDCGDE